MLLAILRRLGQMVFVMVGISILVFLIFFATPGADPAARIAGRNAAPEVLAAVRHDFGFDRPLPVQYVLMMRHLFVAGDLASYVNRGQLVLPTVLECVPATLSLVFGAAVLWVVASLLVGTVAVTFRNRWPDRLLMITGLIGVSMPVFWVGQMANLITQSRYHDTWLFAWVPPLGYTPLTQDPWLWFKSMLIPWVTLAILYIGIYGRVLRSSLIEALQEDYVRTARAKGLSERRVLLRHALRTSLIAFVSLFGLDFGALVGGGALLTEDVFDIQGVGKLTVQALQNLDLPFIMATVMYAAFFVVLANAVVDIAYAALDPRVRHARA
jgi:peptide/nickel transport system permease protein